MLSFRFAATAALAVVFLSACNGTNTNAPKQITPLVATPAAQANPPVVITQDEFNYTLSNGTVTAKVRRGTAELVSLMYKGVETMYVPKPGDPLGGGHPWGYWEQTPGPEARVVQSVTIDPATNNGDRAEISIKAFFIGNIITPGAPGGGATADIDIRYTMGRGDSGVYTTAIYTHQPTYPAGQVGEARWGAKLNPAVFDWLSVDWNRNKMMISAEDWAKGTQLNAKEIRRINTGDFKGSVEHKYDYSAIQFDTPAFGWSSTTKHIGFFMINPTIEYLSGGPTKVELTCHRDLNDVAAPTVLDYWHGGHYGGGNVGLAQGEVWSKVVGPIFNYVNTGDTPNAIFQDALNQAAKEAAAWPYGWLNSPDYPHKSERATVHGQLVLDDPQFTGQMTHVEVGLAHPEMTITGGRGGGRGGFGGPQAVDWQSDAKNYQFWVRGDDSGNFSIPNVRPGSYTLYAIADGVLGQFSKTDVTVTTGQTLDLGKLDWQPVRFGKQLWDVGIPNRSAKEFLHGNAYWHWGLYLQYASDFPNDVNYVIGQSDFHKDWNYAQVPHWDGVEKVTEDRSSQVLAAAATRPAPTDAGARAAPMTRTRVAAANAAAGTNYAGRASPWNVIFDLPEAPHGKATLRVAFCGSGGSATITMNGKTAANMLRTNFTRTVGWDGIQGVWQERDIAFDASLMQAGKNVLTLTILAGNPSNGIMYDYLRLELDESAPAPPPPGPEPVLPGRGGFGGGGGFGG